MSDSHFDLIYGELFTNLGNKDKKHTHSKKKEDLFVSDLPPKEDNNIST